MEEVKYIPGDLVTNHHGTILRIVDIVAGFLNTNYQDGSTGLYISRKDVAPISLTPTIMETNGWKKSFESPTFIDYKKENVIIQYDKFEKTFSYAMIFEFRWVHQLQHLLFGLGFNSELKV